ncbi:expressed unknown protein [Seminavis robusta]|uniref:AB hydrolase-1 domain-containing protein n=1 Tax=Seminavis robusta TaxID=568900 RepID=A0A9N8H0N2_9STRA|nr:expressed unknown protein [Seminavis robusta]|eukprot:Sro4_g003360.1 n/a (639) ;mRNA; f:129046-130962
MSTAGTGTMEWLWEAQESVEAMMPVAVKEQLPIWWPLPVLVYLFAEVCFYIYFKTVMVPFANTIIAPSEYRDYGRDRHKLILRILERVTRTAKVNGRDDLEDTARYLVQWFNYAPNHLAAGSAHKKKKKQQTPTTTKYRKNKLKATTSPKRRVVKFASSDNTPSSSNSNNSDSSSSSSKPSLLVKLSDSSIGSSLGTESVCSSSATGSSPDDSHLTMSDDDHDEMVVSLVGAGQVVDDTASDSASLDDDDDDSIDDDFDDTDDDEVDDNASIHAEYTVTVLRKDDVDDFMAWGFFGKFVSTLEEWEREEMENCYQVLEEMHGIRFQPGRSPHYKLKYLLSLEDCVAMHRPLIFYLQVFLVKWFAGLLFRLAGFSRHVAESGVICWYKPAADDDYSKNLLPLCFFHGVGPGGHALYTLMVLLGLNRTGRAIFLFENHSVTCSLNFKALTDNEIVDGVREMIDRFCGPDRPISLMGHSFGSSALTWILHSDLKPRIRQMVILEPVSLMLSESDVICTMAKPIFKAAIDLVLEHYIRRQYPWYNSELWLEDIPDDVHVIIGLAGRDGLIPTPKITQEIEAFCAVNPKVAKNMDFIYWKNNLHGLCLVLPWCWKDINDAMLKQELAMMMQSKSSRRRSRLKL